MKHIYIISRITIAVIFLYHGLVPKILFGNAQEVAMNDVLIPFLSERAALLISGFGEIMYAILILVFYKSKVLLYPAIFFGVSVTIALIIVLPGLFQNAFNPFSINLALVVLCVINLAVRPDLVTPDGSTN